MCGDSASGAASIPNAEDGAKDGATDEDGHMTDDTELNRLLDAVGNDMQTHLEEGNSLSLDDDKKNQDLVGGDY